MTPFKVRLGPLPPRSIKGIFWNHDDSMASLLPYGLPWVSPGHLPPATGGLAALHSHGTAPAKEVVLALSPSPTLLALLNDLVRWRRKAWLPARLLHPGLDPLELGWFPGRTSMNLSGCIGSWPSSSMRLNPSELPI